VKKIDAGCECISAQGAECQKIGPPQFKPALKQTTKGRFADPMRGRIRCHCTSQRTSNVLFQKQDRAFRHLHRSIRQCQRLSEMLKSPARYSLCPGRNFGIVKSLDPPSVQRDR
jgi:hypothetical protein